MTEMFHLKWHYLIIGFLFVCSIFARAVYAAEDAPDPTVVPPAPLNERVLRVPGDPQRPVTLEVTLYTPNGNGPFPLAIMNHGASGDKPPRFAPRYRITFSAYYFLARGYAVALPMMRGFAGSGGDAEFHGCDLELSGMNNAKDIRAVIEYMSAQPYIDGEHVVVAGQSFGGWNTLAFGALGYPKVEALVDFVGGVRPSDCRRPEAALQSAAGIFGAHTKVPSVWVYGDNDSLFSPPLWRAMHEKYVAAGGKAELVDVGNFMKDAHNMLGFPESMAIWGPKVDALLEQVGLPSKVIYPDYLPTPFPPPSHYARIDDIEAIPYINEQGRQFYQKFLSKPMPRAIVLAPSRQRMDFQRRLRPPCPGNGELQEAVGQMRGLRRG